MNGNWIEAMARLHQRNQCFVLVTLLAVRGSTPRDANSKMLVTEHEIYDSIGGGNLEHQVTARARTLIAAPMSAHRPQKCIEEFSLGASLGQCCGGHTSVLLEYFPATQFNVVLFGGGHVASATMTILRELPCKRHWVDSREAFVEQHPHAGELHYCDAPESLIDRAPAQSSYVIMTHDHGLDFALCERVLQRQRERRDVRYCGLIGSRSKSAKFRKRLAHRGFEPATIEQLKCPLGLAGITGKRPMEVAVSVAAELIQLHADDCRSAAHASIDRTQLPRLVAKSGAVNTGAHTKRRRCH